MNTGIFAVIVLYKCRPQSAISVSTLLQAASLCESERLSVLLYDNTPDRQEPGVLPKNVEYYAPGRNAGLAEAYNYAIAIASQQGFAWLLTLDQDTQLPSNFLKRYYEIVSEIDGTPEIAAVVPQMVSGDQVLSPHHFLGGALVRWFAKGYTGIPQKKVYAFNSASLLRVSALRQVHGYEPRFWLDCSDTALFHRLGEYGKRVFIAGDLQVQHRFAMVETDGRVSPERYRNILLAESAFWDAEMGHAAGLERTGRLTFRFLRYLCTGSADLSSITREMLSLRIFHSRGYRLERWRRLTESHVTAAPGHLQRIMKSVCMATCNGERFVEEQVASILSQLDERDELIIVDDASRDCTVARIQSLQDARIKLIVHAANRGAVSSFEEAIRDATGDVLLLSDMDDVWAPEKVSKIMETFAANPNARIVATSHSIIDGEGKTIASDEIPKKRRFHSGFFSNLLRNHFQGSTMAFRSSLIRDILPFPKGKIFLHDAWIGTRNAAKGGDTVFLDEPLLFYRRHQSNLSRTQSRARQIRSRCQLICAHLRTVLLDWR